MKLRKKLLTAAICLALSTGHALAMPTGGQIVTGDNNISGFVPNPESGAAITFGGNGVINWEAFNIGANESLVFDVAQNATAFNYVSGGDISTILGNLTQSGAGSMVLCNPNGIVVGNGAVINANDLTMMTVSMTDEQLKNVFTDGGSNILMTSGEDREGNPALIDIKSGANFNITDALNLYGGRVAIADGVFISREDDVNVQELGITRDAVNVLSARSVATTAMRTATYSGDAIEEIPDEAEDWKENITNRTTAKELESIIRNNVHTLDQAKELMRYVRNNPNITLLKQAKFLAVIIKNVNSLSEADNQVKNMSAANQAENVSTTTQLASMAVSSRLGNMSKAGSPSTRTVGVGEYILPSRSKLHLLEGKVTLGNDRDATAVDGGQTATVILGPESGDGADTPGETDAPGTQKFIKVDALGEEAIKSEKISVASEKISVAMEDIQTDPVLANKIEQTTDLRIESIEKVLKKSAEGVVKGSLGVAGEGSLNVNTSGSTGILLLD